MNHLPEKMEERNFVLYYRRKLVDALRQCKLITNDITTAQFRSLKGMIRRGYYDNPRMFLLRKQWIWLNSENQMLSIHLSLVHYMVDDREKRINENFKNIDSANHKAKIFKEAYNNFIKIEGELYKYEESV